MLSRQQIEHFSEFFNHDFLKILPKVKKKIIPGLERWIADVHAPYHSKGHYEMATDSQAGVLRILGDFFDMYTKSHYRKVKDIAFRDEFRQAYWLLADTCAKYDEVYLMISNHDMRFRKWIYDNAPVEMLSIIGTSLNLVEDLLGLIPNLKLMNHLVSGNRVVEYIAQSANAVFTHIEKSSITPGKVVQDIHKDFQFKWKSHYQLRDYDILVQAHNHIAYDGWIGETRLFQIPCLIDPSQIAFDYCYGGKLQGNPPNYGYMETVKENGIYNKHKTNIVCF